MFNCNQNGITITADKSLPRVGDYSCIECLEQLIPIKGRKYKIHFRHKNNSGCAYSDEMPVPAEADPSDNMAQLQESYRIATLTQRRAKLQLELARVNHSLAQSVIIDLS